MQQEIGFEEAVERLVVEDPRYHRDAYYFLHETLDFTMKRLGRDQSQHVNGRELLLGFRDNALEQFGPMVPTVLEEWGIRCCGDVGTMVFNLIGTGVFGRSEQDHPEDFDDVFDFSEAFVESFRTQRPTSCRRPAAFLHSEDSRP